jgi:hypothetical protein
MDNKDLQDTEQTAGDDALLEQISDGIAEVLTAEEIDATSEEQVVLATEVVEQFISPLMIQKAAGATSQVTVTMNPAGGVSSAHSVKARNALVNLRHVATAVPAGLPVLASFYEKHGISGDLGSTALGVLYLFAVLKPIAHVLKITITQQAAALLMVMWNSRREFEDSVPLEGLLTKVNSTFQEYGWKTIDHDELTSYLRTLEKINSIERVGEYQSISMEMMRWRLKETVEIAR